MANPVSVKWFTNAMSGAPVMTGEVNKLIPVLDACLKDGFGSVTLSSLVVSSSVATGTVNTGHGFLDYAVVLVAGATPSGLNGDKRITVTGTNTFTFDATGISDQTATGTITAKMSPLGFSKSFSGTNKAVYRADQIESTRFYLQVIDSDARYPELNVYESMTDVDTGTDKTGPRTWVKSTLANTTVRDWMIVGDDRSFYLLSNADGSTWPGAVFFGDIVSYRPGDIYHCLLDGHVSSSNLSRFASVTDTSYPSLIVRSYNGASKAIGAVKNTHRRTFYTLGMGGESYPAKVDARLNLWPVEIWEVTNDCSRGLMPGLWNPVHANTLLDGTIVSGSGVTSGRKLAIRNVYQGYSGTSTCNFILDLTGPWR